MDTSSSAPAELDFFGMEEKLSNHSPSATQPPTFERRRSFRDIQGVISKINPEIVKSVIENGGMSKISNQTCPTLCDPTLRLNNNGSYEDQKNFETAPMTIFYNGIVAVFQVSPHKAQDILKVADHKNHAKFIEYDNLLGSTLDGDLPITRKNSLQKFLEKRKERLTEPTSYDIGARTSSAAGSN